MITQQKVSTTTTTQLEIDVNPRTTPPLLNTSWLVADILEGIIQGLALAYQLLH